MDMSSASRDLEKHPEVHSSPVDRRSDSQTSPRSSIIQCGQAGITFYIRDKIGLTSAIRNHTTLPVLLEAGYSSHSISSLNKLPILIVLAGGVGITAVLPYLRAHLGRVKLYWGC